MKISSIINMSFNSMRASKMRTALTILGIVIGITSVIIVYSAGEGIRGLLYKQIETFGTDIIQTEVKVPTGKRGTSGNSQSAMALAQGVQITTLTVEDMEDVKKAPNIKNGYAAVMGQEQISYQNILKKSLIFGVSSSYLDIDKSKIDYGRFYTEAEDKSKALVVVLGSKMKDILFGDSDAIGKYVKIRKSKFNVVGVLKEKGSVMGLDFDSMVYVPTRTLQKRIMGIDNITYMVHQLYDLNLADEAAEEARLVIRQNHNIDSVLLKTIPGEVKVKVLGEGDTDTTNDDFRVVTMAESMDILDNVMGAVTLLLLAIVAISLIVGGVGIMNIMYVVVTERTAEIGLRKAVGAKYDDILKQFLIESVFITILGGIVGIILGVFLSYLISFGAKLYGLDWVFSVPLKAYFVSLGFSVFFGIVFGVYPAKKAAILNPIDALRVE